jgi:lambda repressor-like predicted transcriptional regulator
MTSFKVTDMPALTSDAQAQLTAMESKYHNILSGHCHGYELFDPHGALEKIRTFATLFYDFFYSFYSQFPAYSEHWRIASETKAMERIGVWIKNFSATRNWVDASIVLTIKQTITNHAEQSLPLLLSKPVIVAPRVPVFASIGTDSPLLTMAKRVESFNAVSLRRKAFVQPLLDAKGWSIAQWAEKAKVSRHTANSYLEGNRKTYHTSMRDLADALGVPYQQFPK